MSIQIQIRGGTSAEHLAFKGVSREITCDTDKKTIVVQDGQTLGGFPLAREDLSNVAKEMLEEKGLANNDADNFTEGGKGEIKFFVGADFVGMVFSAPLESAAGFLLCDGAELPRTTYARLFARIGTIFGEGDGETTFNIPDYRGAFLRGVGEGAESDFATRQLSAAPNIAGTFEPRYSNGGRAGFTNLSSVAGAFYKALAGTSSQIAVDGSGYGTIALGLDASLASAVYGRGAAEVRPTNHAVNYFIKY